MTITTPAAPRTPLDRLRWAVADAWTITGRDLAHWARQPAPVVVGLLFPVLMVVMFGYLFGTTRTTCWSTSFPRRCPPTTWSRRRGDWTGRRSWSATGARGSGSRRASRPWDGRSIAAW